MFHIRSRHLGIVLLCGVVGLWASLLLASVVKAELPPRPSPPTTPPTPVPVSYSDLTGAYIELVVVGAPPDVWTVVQWRDALGGWHDVEGWQGALDDADSKRWWVAPRDLGTGPFRWQVLTRPAGETLLLSEAFMLPAEDRAILFISATPPTN